MAYMDQDKKARIAAALKPVVPAGWKYTLGVDHHSTIVMNILAAPFDLIAALNPAIARSATTKHHRVNQYHVAHQFADEAIAEIFQLIVDALNTGNHDRSDVMTDYFDVGHYVELNIGRWNRPFETLPFNPVKAPA